MVIFFAHFRAKPIPVVVHHIPFQDPLQEELYSKVLWLEDMSKDPSVREKMERKVERIL